jgi:hypothetical protein
LGLVRWALHLPPPQLQPPLRRRCGRYRQCEGYPAWCERSWLAATLCTTVVAGICWMRARNWPARWAQPRLGWSTSSPSLPLAATCAGARAVLCCILHVAPHAVCCMLSTPCCSIQRPTRPRSSLSLSPVSPDQRTLVSPPKSAGRRRTAADEPAEPQPTGGHRRGGSGGGSGRSGDGGADSDGLSLDAVPMSAPMPRASSSLGPNVRPALSISCFAQRPTRCAVRASARACVGGSNKGTARE